MVFDPVDGVDRAVAENALDEFPRGERRWRSTRPRPSWMMKGRPPIETRVTAPPLNGFGSAKSQADVISLAHGRQELDQLLLVAPPAVKEHQQGVGVIRLVPLGHERGVDRCFRPDRRLG